MCIFLACNVKRNQSSLQSDTTTTYTLQRSGSFTIDSASQALRDYLDKHDDTVDMTSSENTVVDDDLAELEAKAEQLSKEQQLDAVQMSV